MNCVVRAYTLLLNLYPPKYRSLFGSEMSSIFMERFADSDSFGHGRPGFIASEFYGVILDLTFAWLCHIRHAALHDGKCGCLPDFRMMRPPWIDSKSYYRLLRAPRN